MYKQQEIDRLISMPKVISDPPRKEMVLDRGTWRNDLRLQSTDGEHHFRMFMRRNDKFQENFSVGLDYLPGDGTDDLPLIRCNGPHEGVETTPGSPAHHACFHIHYATEANMIRGLDPACGAVLTKEYGSLEQAVQFMLTKCNIQDPEGRFDGISQLDLFEGGND